jgi:hypothetical protein
MDEPNDAKRSPAAQAAKYLGVGMTWAASTGLFMYAGTRLDERWGTDPVLTLVGALVGASAGFYYLYRQVVAEGRRPGPKQEDQEK